MNVKDKLFLLCLFILIFISFFRTNVTTHNKKLVVINDRSKNVSIGITATVYQPTEAQCDKTPFITGNGSKITNKSYYAWCAVSRDLLNDHLNFNDTIIIKSENKLLKLIVKDAMNSRFYRKIDILIPVKHKELTKCLSDSSNLAYPFLNKKIKIIKIIPHE